MANEVELKLSLPSYAVDGFMQDPRLGSVPPQVLELDNQYFDTPDLLLNQAHCALRIRKSQFGFKQTLKNKGTALAGLHVRGEWEYDIEQAQIDWSLFPAEVQLSPAIRAAIAPIFKTDFQRHVWLLQYGDSEIELVLDQGVISSNNNNVPLCEVELELKSGNVSDLFALARQLANDHPLVPCDINKAERGYRLLHPKLSFFKGNSFALYDDSQADVDVLALMHDTLTRMSRNWDDFANKTDWWSLLVLSRQVQAMCWMLNELPMLNAEIEQTWQNLSDSLITLLQPASLTVALYVDDNSHSRGLSQRLLGVFEQEQNAALERFIQSNLLGQSMLVLGEFLQAQTHTISFNEYLLSSLHNVQVSQWQEPNARQLQTLQAMAYFFKRLQHPAYDVLNRFINKNLVVTAMRHTQGALDNIKDESSRAKLASWVRRLTVENRACLELRGQLLTVLVDS